MKIQNLLGESAPTHDLMQMFWQLATRRNGFWWSEAAGRSIWENDLDKNGQYKARGGLTNPNNYFIVTCDEKGVLTIQQYRSETEETSTVFDRNEPPRKRASVPGSHAQRHLQRKIYPKSK